MRARGGRRALSHVGGAVVLEGDASRAELLAKALDVPTSAQAENAARSHVHGFHSYPARMHPLTAQRLLESISQPGDTVLDPFCGSGTVLVEARLAGRRGIGIDANPLAVRLARLKVRGTREDERQRLLEGAQTIASVADERRRARSGASRRYGKEDVALFAPHVLLELDGLRVGLERIDNERLRADLSLVLSAILVKVSRRASDTSPAAVERRIAAGYPSRLFVRKTEELCSRLAEIAPQLTGAPPCDVLEGDARVLAGKIAPAKLVLTSPPYPGVYDYLAHHAARLRWLGLVADRFADVEIGARRRLDPLGIEAGHALWKRELTETLRAIERALAPGASAVILLADSVIAGAPVYALDLVRTIAPNVGLTIAAIASQLRPHFHGPTARVFARRPRSEHAIWLCRAPRTSAHSPRTDALGASRRKRS